MKYNEVLWVFWALVGGGAWQTRRFMVDCLYLHKNWAFNYKNQTLTYKNCTYYKVLNYTYKSIEIYTFPQLFPQSYNLHLWF